MRQNIRFLALILLVLFCAVACKPTASPSPAATATMLPSATPSPLPPTPTFTPLPTATPTPLPPTATPIPPTVAPTSTPSTPVPAPAAPADPQPITFKASDGQELQGTYYPAAVENAPLVVLIHWVRGDQSDWTEIAFWLQNRGLGGQSPNPQNLPWHDPSWFPPMLEGQPVAVFAFSLRGCTPGGCDDWIPRQWLLDVQAAMQTASQLKGIDPQRIVAAGASVGADGAIDGCAWLNEQAVDSTAKSSAKCLGAFSLSPGGYLKIPYADAVKSLQAEQPPSLAWCLSAEKDQEAAAACGSARGDDYRAVSFSGSYHGMTLIDPQIEPKTMDLFLEWLKASLGQ